MSAIRLGQQAGIGHHKTAVPTGRGLFGDNATAKECCETTELAAAVSAILLLSARGSSGECDIATHHATSWSGGASGRAPARCTPAGHGVFAGQLSANHCFTLRYVSTVQPLPLRNKEKKVPFDCTMVALILLAISSQAMANGADDMIRHRGAGSRSARPPIERSVGRAPSATRTTGRVCGEAL